MKKLSTLVLAITLQWLVSGCFRQELQAAEYHIPAMSTPVVEARIQAVLKGIPEIEIVSADIESQTVTVTYQSSAIRKMNIEEAIALAGFAVNNRPANPKATLPKGIK